MSEYFLSMFMLVTKHLLLQGERYPPSEQSEHGSYHGAGSGYKSFGGVGLRRLLPPVVQSV